MTMTIKIKLDNGTDLELTLDEAKKLYGDLKELFETSNDNITPYYPIYPEPYRYYPYYIEYPEPYRYYPHCVEYTSSSNSYNYSN